MARIFLFLTGPGVPPTKILMKLIRRVDFIIAFPKVNLIWSMNLPIMSDGREGTFGVFTGKMGVEGREREAKNRRGFSGLMR